LGGERWKHFEDKGERWGVNQAGVHASREKKVHGGKRAFKGPNAVGEKKWSLAKVSQSGAAEATGPKKKPTTHEGGGRSQTRQGNRGWKNRIEENVGKTSREKKVELRPFGKRVEKEKDDRGKEALTNTEGRGNSDGPGVDRREVESRLRQKGFSGIRNVG